MTLVRRLGRLLAGPSAPLSPDLAGDDIARVRDDLQGCLDGAAPVAAGRRAAALAGLYRRLSPEGKARFAEAVAAVGADAAADGRDRYAKMEELELFGRAAARLALVDGFAPPRRRLLAAFCGTDDGRGMLARMRRDAGAELAAEIDSVLGAAP